MSDKAQLASALGFSAALHFIVATILYGIQAGLFTNPSKLAENKPNVRVIDVAVLSVSSDTSHQQDNLVSTVETAVNKEQIEKNRNSTLVGSEISTEAQKLGSNLPTGTVGKPPFQGLRPLNTEVVTSGKIDSLALENLSSLKQLERYDNSWAKNFSVSSDTGSNYYDLNLPEGEITLLNTKSHRYAGFIIRVAKRVFYKLVAEVRANPRLLPEKFKETYTVYFDRSGKVHSDKLHTGFAGRIADLVIDNAPDPNPPVSLFSEYSTVDKQSDRFPFVFIVEINSLASQTGRNISIRLTAGLP